MNGRYGSNADITPNAKAQPETFPYEEAISELCRA
jgi:hypothetical protein